eukprot:TRINITY_DN4035_c0_g1_i7.p1 TRINITY_DN4035_c0_g1~~TRINITY_DN4035_c0_g1_i7.p1  ORF type:complete len:180 (+),score=27.53 TRINITY_DN4035_c0_g1_i7:111-650(+)
MLDLPKDLQQKALGRQKYIYKDQEIYEWEQTIDEVHIYIKPPKACLPKYKDQVLKQLGPGQTLPKLEVEIKSGHIKVGIKGTKPYIDEDLEKTCVASDSIWCIEDDELHIILQKGLKADVWPSVFKGHGGVDELTKAEIQKKLLLERFQEENPGFDFSNAQFNGMAPDPRTFMGGVKYS